MIFYSSELVWVYPVMHMEGCSAQEKFKSHIRWHMSVTD